ncbi:hypothetical protein [Spirosoma pollinicola]|uniref:Uncharacterized protein n=1 Tax=Spirosoma pollinicola TaxID=2057025 RepID=A0A2K8YSG6_9BACT|nr:hypothetical protein [Spirosoma pollinicola]AUD00572.1 hypothetical protein CWM47_01300 [Spirosoma pollinicola]
MQTDDVKSRLISQLKEFLTYTVNTDNDTIVSQYTLITALADQVVAKPESGPVANIIGPEEVFNADYDYFLSVNTLSPQPAERKTYALEGLQERFRKLVKQLQEA